LDELPIPLPEDTLLQTLLPNDFHDGLYSLVPAWTGRVEVVCEQGLASLLETNHIPVDILFDLIGVKTDRPQYYGPVWVAQSASSNWSVHEYRHTFPMDAEILACITAEELYNLLGASCFPSDGYGDNWWLFRVAEKNRMDILHVNAFWMVNEEIVKRFKIARGIATPQIEDAEQAAARNALTRVRAP